MLTGKGSGKREFSRGGYHKPLGLWEFLAKERNDVNLSDNCNVS